MKLESVLKMNNGVEIPIVGYGTYLIPDDQVCNSVVEAIEVGYRHIDTAAVYENETGVGLGIKKSGIEREKLFVTSKVWNTERGYETTKKAFADTLARMGLDYLDLYLIHWPANTKQFGDKAKELNAETWRAMEELYEEGKIKSIGLSNFMPHHIEELMETAKIKPMVNQIEVHPGWTQLDVVNYCNKHDILVEAWSPLGHKAAIENDELKLIADKYNKTVAQVCVRWCLQVGTIPIPKTASKKRMVENVDVFDFKLEEEDVLKINALGNLGGQCLVPDEIDF